MVRVGFLQFDPEFGNVEGNRARVLNALDDIETDLIVLPELPFTGYLFRDRAEAKRLAEDPSRSDTVDALVGLCRRRSTFVCTGFAERDGDRVYNASLIVGPRGIVHRYRKLHLFRDEKSWFDPGDLPLSVKRIRGTPVGVMVCFDWAFPEVARRLALDGARILAHPSNLVLDYGQKTMLTRCLENAVFAVTCNRTGADVRDHGSVEFTGRSQIAGPRGELIQRSRPDGMRLHVEAIDPSKAADKKLTPRNHLLRDRRPEFYG